MNRSLVLFIFCFYPVCLYGQVDSIIRDAVTPSAVKSLPEAVVNAYGQSGTILKLPAAVHVISATQLVEYNNTSILPAVNTTPGVRMEERSPGSYRLGIRGSSLSAPFGVRNIKVYYNDIPYTDPGGNTYLNQLGFYNIQSLEIIKGPGSSLYGAGMGGVVLISSMPQMWAQGVSLNYTGGSYGLVNTEAELRIGDTSFRNVIRYQHLASDGYRQQSALKKNVLSWDAVSAHGKGATLSAHILYGDLYYQTPGALTAAQYRADAAQARPAAGTVPGAVDARAAISQTSMLAGITYSQQFGHHWSNKTTLYGDYARQLNPNLRNYSRTSEPHFGGRSQFQYDYFFKSGWVQCIAGAEAQQGLAQYKTYQNIAGNPRNLQSDQEIDNRLIAGFAQLTVQLRQWIFTAGLSINQLHVALRSISSSAYVEQQRTFSNQLAPRIALLHRITENMSVFGAVEKGFSPPATAELAPTGSAVNFDLQPTQGWNYELGLRGRCMQQRLYYDVALFYFALQNAIVQRRDSAAGDYYLNAGSTRQAGIEAFADYRILQHSQAFITGVDIYLSYTGNYFHYDRFVQLTNDYSGKRLPGTAPNTVSAGITITTMSGIYANINYFFSDKIAVDDANNSYAAEYHLLGARLGYRAGRKRYTWNVFVGADNILDQLYSLGNDINAVGGRYYNAAAPRNYYAGLSLGWAR